MTLSLAVPSELTVGDTWSFTLSIPDYERPTWTATLYLQNESGNISVSSSGAGPDHVFSVAAATTAAYTAGKYRWRVRVSDGTTKVTVDEGWITVNPDPGASGSRDLRTWAQRTLEAIEATLEGRATTDQLSMQIRDRSIARTPVPELVAWRDQLRNEVRAQESAEKKGLGRDIKVRFKRI